MTQLTCIHFTVSGRVQGVYYRASTQHTAIALGITGWVSNMEDGRVEGQASGSHSQIEDFVKWLHIGPNLAAVATVDVENISPQIFEDFEVRY